MITARLRLPGMAETVLELPERGGRPVCGAGVNR